MTDVENKIENDAVIDAMLDDLDESDDEVFNVDYETEYNSSPNWHSNDNTDTDKSDKSLINKTNSRYLNNIIFEITDAYIQSLDKNNLPPPLTIENELLRLVNVEIARSNADIPITAWETKNGKAKPIFERLPWAPISKLTTAQITALITAFHYVVRVDTAGEGLSRGNDLLGIYISDETNPLYGTYDTDETTLCNIAKLYDHSIDKRKFEDIIYFLTASAPKKPINNDRDLIAVNNGIFNYKTKQLLPFNPDIVFLAKSRVNYNPNAVSPVITNPIDGSVWNVDDWFKTLSDDAEIVRLLWQTLSCIIRPFVSWKVAIWLYSSSGNNGKGTLCSLMRNLCGPGTHVSMPLSLFEKDFALEPLIHANAIITDENNVADFIEKSAKMKAIITNDLIEITRKFKTSVTFRFWGLMVQCINDLPRVKDRSNSFYRRQIIVPMDKCFTGAEKRYIKDDYLNRPDVLEYVLKQVLEETPFYALDIPKRCSDLLTVYKETNDPTRAFWVEFSNRFAWDLLPGEFVYDLYLAWCKRFNPTGKPEGRTHFKQQSEQLLTSEQTFGWLPTSSALSTANKCAKPEPLILEYNLNNWKRKHYIGADPDVICSPIKLDDRLRGYIRKNLHDIS